MTPRFTERTQMSAEARAQILRRKGHTLTLEGTRYRFTATIHRKNGTTHSITLTPFDLDDYTTSGLVFHRYPQQVLMVHAIHAICDWDNEQG